MAKQSRGSNRTANRPATPAPAAPSNRPSGQRPAGQRPAGRKPGEPWQPNRVSASKSSSRPNRTLIATIGSIVVGLAIVAFVAIQQLGGTSTGGTNDPIITPGHANSTLASIHTDGRTLGDASAPVTIDLYGDFRCSACYQFTVGGTERQVVTQLIATGKAKLVWHDFTIIDHNDGAVASRDAANAAWCGADQGKFWVMHDWLYANQSPTEAASAFAISRLVEIGRQAGLDMSTYQSCVQNGTHNAEITSEQTSLPASVAGHGTPSVLVGGTFVNATFADIQKAVEAAAPQASGSAAAPSASAAAPSGS